MRNILRIILISTLFTALIVGFEHFSPVPRVADRPKDCCGELEFTNRHGFPFLLREDVSGGIAPMPPKTQYYIDNYIKLGAIVFVGATIVQLAITFYKRSNIYSIFVLIAAALILPLLQLISHT